MVNDVVKINLRLYLERQVVQTKSILKQPPLFRSLLPHWILETTNTVHRHQFLVTNTGRHLTIS